MKSSKARKQRKTFFNAPLHQKRKQIASHLEENLLLKYDKRRIPVVREDTVKVMRGAFKGHEDKVLKVDLKKHLVEVEGVTITKADGKQVAKPVHPSNLLITKLNLTDKWRRQRLEEGLSSEAKEEIEREASDQIKQLEEERKAEEERRKREEEAAAKEEEKEEPPEPEETTEEPSAEEPSEKKPEVEKKEETPETETTTEPVKEPEETEEKKPSSEPKKEEVEKKEEEPQGKKEDDTKEEEEKK